jgi:hypothetical protein
MRLENSTNPDESLHRVLREWELNETLPPRFEERVWHRIARKEAAAPASWWVQLVNRIGQAMARPSLAVSYVTVLLAAGLAAGYWHAQIDNARASQELGSRYVRMIDSYELPRR